MTTCQFVESYRNQMNQTEYKIKNDSTHKKEGDPNLKYAFTCNTGSQE